MLDEEKDLNLSSSTAEAAAPVDAEDENHIRERLGKYGLRKLFDAGGMCFITLMMCRYIMTDVVVVIV